MRTYLIAGALSALSLASAEMKNFTINTGALPLSQKASWCQAELNTCNTLCVDAPNANDCQPADLTYQCTCQNGTAPGLEYYTQTIYTFVCNQAFEDCIASNVGNKTGQDACTTNIKDNCGTLDPNDFVAGSGDSSSSSSSASTTSGPTGTGASSTSPTATGSGGATTSASQNAAPTAAYLGNGAAVFAAGIFAALL
ncbi:hypothetical protein NKR19_g3952 [Coniochaeta hoffmannii]|uniref:DUF7707 domain-containing protein n=1 Tax=Coniochaeta hoffmannii TaxID=91930 RepID=A0AA38RUJ0_9PEZI|nr:hypothetical protein NKR19_g3952 [Coniochaeta hoffmannii]